SSLYAYSTSSGIAAVDMEEAPPSLKRLILVKEEEEEEVEEEREQSTQLKLLIGRKLSRSTGEAAISLSYSFPLFSANIANLLFSNNNSRDRRLRRGETDAKNRNTSKSPEGNMG